MTENGTSTAVVPLSNYEALEKHKASIAAALPVGSVTVERYIRAVQTQLRRPETHLAECTYASFMGAVVTLAQLGLEPGPLHLSYLEARKNRQTGNYEARPGIEYRGFIELAHRSNRVQRWRVFDVHENDDFSLDQATGECHHTWDHKAPRAARGKIVGHYGILLLRGGVPDPFYMSCEDCEDYKKHSQLGSQNRGPWKDHKEAMHRKTVFLRMEPGVPKTAEMALAFAADGQVVASDPEQPADTSFDYDADWVEDEPDDRVTAAELAGKSKAEPDTGGES